MNNNNFQSDFLNKLSNQFDNFYQAIYKNRYYIYSYIYVLYQLIWTVFNVILIFYPKSRVALLSYGNLNYYNLIIFDILINIGFYVIGTYNWSLLFIILNIFGIIYMCLLLPFFGIVHILTTIIIIVLMIYTMYITFKKVINKIMDGYGYENENNDDNSPYI